MQQDAKTSWDRYCATELAILTPLLQRRGYVLEEAQPHLRGERFLMRAATTTGGTKLILLGRDASGQKVVIKATREPSGQEELRHERQCRKTLHTLVFAAKTFHTPTEMDWFSEEGFLVSIQAFIEQATTFLDRPIEEQFDFAIQAFRAQEGTHATTFKHRRIITNIYQQRSAADYIRQFERFTADLLTTFPDAQGLAETLKRASDKLRTHSARIDQYGGFLTHTDFVPHNIRIAPNGTMYLLDHSSLVFGNKHEGWARFLNFMELYHPQLAKLLTQYVADNRAPEEAESLRLMRLYRLGELLWYYQNKLPYCEGNLRTLNEARIFFWADILRATLENTWVSEQRIEDYRSARDTLRSDDEKERQRNLH